jgi:hypothetical protein
VLLGGRLPKPSAEVFVGLKFTIIAAMHAGTLLEALQLGAPGLTGLAKFGFSPKVLLP